MKQVNELVEWVAEKICTMDGNEWGFINDTTKTLFDGAPSKSIYRGRAKEILSHPDLALKDREKGTPYDIFHELSNEYSVIGCCRGALNQWPTECQDEFWGVFANRIDNAVIPIAKELE